MAITSKELRAQIKAGISRFAANNKGTSPSEIFLHPQDWEALGADDAVNASLRLDDRAIVAHGDGYKTFFGMRVSFHHEERGKFRLAAYVRPIPQPSALSLEQITAPEISREHARRGH